MTRKAEIINELKQIEARSAELEAGAETADQAELEARTKEAEELATRQKALKDELQKIEAEEKAAEDFAQKRSGVDITPKKEKTMNKIDEIRNSKAYVDAYAKFIKTGEVEEVRSILTTNADNQYVTNADGQLPVPEFVQTTINTAWNSNELFNMIKQTAVKGNLKIGFELSATDAVIHEEGSEAPDPETLKLGIVTLVPKTIKKWIYVSDEVIDMDSEDFLKYIYAELTQKIVKKAIDIAIAKILASPTTATATAASVPVVAPDGISTVDAAEAELTDEINEDNVVLIMHKKTRAYLKKLAKLAGYNVDPFNNYKVFTNDTLDAMTGASGETGNFMIVGDLTSGVQMNMPNGKNPTFKFDDLTYAEKDMVKIIGRMPAGIGVVACDRLCVVKA